MDQEMFVEDSLQKVWSDMVIFHKFYLVQFLNTLPHIIYYIYFLVVNLYLYNGVKNDCITQKRQKIGFGQTFL